MSVIIKSGASGNTANVDANNNLQVVTYGTGATAAAVPSNAALEGARGATANPTAVTDGQMVAVMADKLGRLVVVHNHVRDMVGSQTTNIASSSAETTIVTQVASTFLDITGLQITNATGTACTITIKDSTGGTTQKKYDLAANGGIVVKFDPPLKQTTVNNTWTATLSVNTVTVDVNVDYVKNI